jgi:bacteriocin-like protein
MSDRPVPKIPEGVLSEEQLAKISGGDCNLSDYIDALGDLKAAYEQVIDFTSYVIERVAG